MIFDNVKYFVERLVTEAPEFAKGMSELTDDFINDIKVETDDFIKEETNLFREMCTDAAYKVSPQAGEALEGFYDIKDKVTKNIDNLLYTVANPQDNLSLKAPISSVSDLDMGDHIFTKNICYTHHGIYIGEGDVIHYSSDDSFDIRIQIVSIGEFADGGEIYKKSKRESPTKYSKSEIVQRAKTRLYEESYNLIFNNCEHFARWCRFDS